MPSIFTIKSTAITLAASLVMSAALPVTTANAGGRLHKGDLIAAGVVGLALGAIIADSSHRRQRRVDHIYHNQPAYIPPQPVVRYDQPYYEPYPRAGDYYDNSYRNNHYRYHQPEQIITRRDDRPAYRPAYQPVRKKRPVEPKVITYNDNPTYGAEPWSAQWYSYCRGKFRSFNAKSGTYLGYDGKRHFCVVK